MALESLSTLRKNRVYAPIILGIAIFILVFITRSFFTDYSDARTELASVKQIESQKQTEYDRLKAMEQSFQSGENTDLTNRVKKIEKDLVESDVFEAIMINNFTRTTGIGTAPISIGGISVDKGSQTPNGLYQGSVSMNVSASSIDNMIDYLTYLTTSTPFVFTLDSINLPIDTASDAQTGGVSLSVTLGIYYYK